MTKLFISHSSKDDAFVRTLRETLTDHGQDVWIDSRQLRGGDPLWPEIQKAIDGASAYAVVVSTDALQSEWVGEELQHALAVRNERGKDKFPVIPLSLNGTKLGVLKGFFREEPVYISVSSEAGGVEIAMNDLLVALGKRIHADVAVTEQPKAEPLEELVLELTDLGFHEEDGVRRASAVARLIYQPATPTQREVESEQDWQLIAPIGPIEVEELRWYLEKYAIWPSHYFRDRARKVEENLTKWGRLLHKQAMPLDQTANVMNAWAKIGDHAGRRFSIFVNSKMKPGATEPEVKTAKEAATLLLALPWELLHDGDGYLFQGAKPVRVRRRLPNTKVLDVPIVATPIRILLVTARPEDDSCGYIDHRTSALPLVEAMESLPGLVKIQVLSPPTLPALRTELERARKENKSYHVVHFDGHGVFNREVGLGGLCFENPEDTGKLESRRHITVFTNELGPLLRDHRIPLVFLEACQTAQAEKASESVASELLKVGVASVVAMSHSVLVETSRRFVEAFYETLADGERVGDAMLAGQRALKDDTFRGRIFGAGELRLEDWFVPVLYQEKDDPQLFTTAAGRQNQEDFKARLARRLGDLPAEPATGFIGRSRELLALQRLLREDRYAVVRGQGGEGKTALAAEFARWMVRSQQLQRAAFVSVELNGNVRAVVDALGKQLVDPNFSAAGDLEEAILHVERALREQAALLAIDNMESVLLPPFMEEETPQALSEDTRAELTAILTLCERLLKAGDTRIIFTSREALPAPFDADRNRRDLIQLDREDAVKLVERVLNAAGDQAGASSDAARDAIEQLVDAVHCHARTLALLAPSLRKHGVEATRASLVELMVQMHEKFPESREKSVFASVELSLRRLSDASRERVHVLGVFHGAVDLDLLAGMMEWDKEVVASFASELVQTGLATPNRYNHLTLNTALCLYLRGRMDVAERESLTAQWVEAMLFYVDFLVRQRSRDIELAAGLTSVELPNLFALLDLVQRKGDAELTISLITSLYRLLQNAGKPRLLEQLAQIRDAASAAIGDTWNHVRFEAGRIRIEQRLDTGSLREAFDEAKNLHQRSKEGGEQAYLDADYDLAMSCFLLARVMNYIGGSEQALLMLDEARQRFEAFEKRDPGRGAVRMVALCLSDASRCLQDLGRLEEAARAAEEFISRSEQLGADRDVAVGKGQLGSIRTLQGRYEEALESHADARERFTRVGEPGMVAMSWHETGTVHQLAGNLEVAEDAYRKSLSSKVQLGDVPGEANTLNQLGIVYDMRGRLEEAAAFYKQAVSKSLESGDTSKEGSRRYNLAGTLRKLQRFDEARQEIQRAMECDAQVGHVAEPWKTWNLLGLIETDTGDFVAAAEAKRKAIACYLAYRRDGGENHDAEGIVSSAITESLLAGDTAKVTAFLQEVAAAPDFPSQQSPYINALYAIIQGSRDRLLADNPDFDYGMATEILLLIERLERRPG